MTKQEILQNMYVLADKAIKGSTLIELEQKLPEDSNEVPIIK